MIGNSNLSNDKLDEILSTCVNIEVLSLRNLKNLTSIDFVKNMPYLRELDLFGCINLTDLSILDDLSSENKLSLKTLRIDNDSIDLSKISITISGLDRQYMPGELGFMLSWHGASGFYAPASVWKKLNNCAELTSLEGGYTTARDVFKDKIIDLSGCTSLKSFSISYANLGKIIFPSSLEKITLVTHSYGLDIEFADDSELNSFFLDSVEGDLNDETFSARMLSLSKCKKLKMFSLTKNASVTSCTLTSLNGMENLSKTLTTIKVDNIKTLSNIESLSDFTNLDELNLNNCNISDLNSLKKCTKITTLSLNSNRITNLSMLKDMLQLNELNLKNNLIEDTASIGEEKIDNLDILINLYNNGNLRKLNISGNSIINWDKLRSVNWEAKDF